MKLKIHLLASVLFLLLSAMSCEDLDTERSEVRLVGLELTNLDYSGIELDSTLSEIKKEAYVIGVNYKLIFEDIDSMLDTFPSSYNPSWNRTPKIIALTDFNEQYPAGSDVSECFTIGSRRNKPYDLLLVMRKFPTEGTHIFSVKFKCFDGTIVENQTKPVILF